MSKSQVHPLPRGFLMWDAVNPHKSYHLLLIHVVDVRLRKMTLHTQRAPNNCGASGRASMTEIKQVLSHNPCLLKISLQTRVADSRLHSQLWLRRQLFDKRGAMTKRLYITVCLCSSASVTYTTVHEGFLSSWSTPQCPIQSSVSAHRKATKCSERQFQSNAL